MTKVTGNRPSTRARTANPVDESSASKKSSTSKRSAATPRPDDAFGRGGTPGVLARVDQSRSVSSSRVNNPLARGLGATSEARAVNFEKMTQDQKYDYLQKMTVQRAGGDPSAWRTGDREVNVVGIRSFNGQPRNAEANRYDDRIYVARMVDGKKTVDSFPASVDPGRQVGDTAYKLGDGFYRDAWTRGNVVGGELGLRQSRDLGVERQNPLSALTGREAGSARAEMISTDTQLQFHRGGKGDVNSASRGCQVIRGDQYERFQRILAQAPASQRDFSYNLTDSSTLPGLRGDGRAQKTGRQIGRTGKHRDSDRKGGIGIIRTPDKRIVW